MTFRSLLFAILPFSASFNCSAYPRGPSRTTLHFASSARMPHKQDALRPCLQLRLNAERRHFFVLLRIKIASPSSLSSCSQVHCTHIKCVYTHSVNFFRSESTCCTEQARSACGRARYSLFVFRATRTRAVPLRMICPFSPVQ